MGRYLSWNRSLLLDSWLRYSPAIKVIRKTAKEGKNRILDVGSGSAGIAYFLKSEVVGVDIKFSYEDFARFKSKIQPIQASGMKLPFRDGAFDTVVSMDLIEHLAAANRRQTIFEILRVARSTVVLGFPFGEASRRHDERALLEERLRGAVLDWREEHVANRLPGQEIHREIVNAVKQLPGATFQWFNHEGLAGLQLRWKLQFLVPKSSRWYGIVFLPLYWIHNLARPSRAYRRIYVIRIVGR